MEEAITRSPEDDVVIPAFEVFVGASLEGMLGCSGAMRRFFRSGVSRAERSEESQRDDTLPSILGSLHYIAGKATMQSFEARFCAGRMKS